jgi:hypothetical protein
MEIPPGAITVIILPIESIRRTIQFGFISHPDQVASLSSRSRIFADE